MDQKYLIVYNGSSEEVGDMLGTIISMRLIGHEIGEIASDKTTIEIAGYKIRGGWSLDRNQIKQLIETPVKWDDIEKLFAGKQDPISFYMYTEEKKD